VFVGTKDLRDKGRFISRITELNSHCEQLIEEMKFMSGYVAQFPNLAMVTKLDLVKVRDEVQLEWRRAGSNARYSPKQVDANAMIWVGGLMVDELKRINALVVVMNRDLKLSSSLLRILKGFDEGLNADQISTLTKRN